ncbi:hypothetical protein [Hymenobacter antarcticus]
MLPRIRPPGAGRCPAGQMFGPRRPIVPGGVQRGLPGTSRRKADVPVTKV